VGGLEGLDTLYIFGPELSFGDWSPNEFGETILNTRMHWRLYSRPSQRFMIARPQAARTAEVYSCTAPSPLSSGMNVSRHYPDNAQRQHAVLSQEGGPQVLGLGDPERP
jgi:hypothetical protein